MQKLRCWLQSPDEQKFGSNWKVSVRGINPLADEHDVRDAFPKADFVSVPRADASHGKTNMVFLFFLFFFLKQEKKKSLKPEKKNTS